MPFSATIDWGSSWAAMRYCSSSFVLAAQGLEGGRQVAMQGRVGPREANGRLEFGHRFFEVVFAQQSRAEEFVDGRIVRRTRLGVSQQGHAVVPIAHLAEGDRSQQYQPGHSGQRETR